MEKRRRSRDYGEQEVVHVVSVKEGEEIRFSVTEVSGKKRADIRYFSERDGVPEKLPSRGIILDPVRLEAVSEGVRKLQEKFSGK